MRNKHRFTKLTMKKIVHVDENRRKPQVITKISKSVRPSKQNNNLSISEQMMNIIKNMRLIRKRS